MAKSRGAAPGTYTTGGVRCTMDPPFDKGRSMGTQHDMPGTFDQARTGGANDLPTRVTDPMGGPSAGGPGQAIETSTPGTIMTERK